MVGIGLNVNMDTQVHDDIRDIASSLRDALGHPMPRLDVLAALMEELERAYSVAQSGGSVRDEWAACLETLGTWVRVAWGVDALEGRAESVDDDGSLVLRLEDGSRVTLPAGEVTLRA